MPLVIAFQMLKGDRAGDGMAGTRVIWKKYADHPVFCSSVQPYGVTDDLSADGGLPPTDDFINPYAPPRV